jgi:hypothetical protein
VLEKYLGFAIPLIIKKKRFREIKDRKLARLYWTQDAIIGLGALATILLGLGSSGRWSALKDFAMIPTALVTALSTFSAFQDYKGEVTRLAKEESDLSKLITEIDIRLLNISAQTSKIPFAVDADETRKWWDRADGIIKGVDDAWVIHISQSGSKN